MRLYGPLAQFVTARDGAMMIRGELFGADIDEPAGCDRSFDASLAAQDDAAISGQDFLAFGCAVSEREVDGPVRPVDPLHRLVGPGVERLAVLLEIPAHGDAEDAALGGPFLGGAFRLCDFHGRGDRDQPIRVQRLAPVGECLKTGRPARRARP